MNTLSLLALKCAYNTFDLSSGLSNVSIRDQMVRAKLLIRDLVHSKEPCREILIVGAGIAGACAAVEAAKHEIRVVCVDRNERPFQLQHVSAHRYVGPYMYEWPAAFSELQHFPPLDWPDAKTMSKFFRTEFGWRALEPMASNVLADKLDTWLRDRLAAPATPAQPHPEFLMALPAAQVRQYVLAFIKGRKPLAGQFKAARHWPDGSVADVDIRPDFVILAAGMGRENCTLVEGVEGIKFWKDDTLWQPAVNTKQVGIFGGGDGAMQDFLRVLSIFNHPLAFIEALKQDHAVRVLLEREYAYLLSIEQQHRLESTWTLPSASHDIWRQIDSQCREVAQRLAMHYCVRRAVAAGVKPDGGGRVELFCREAYFGKAYLLNRFMLHLLNTCRRESTEEFDGRLPFAIHFMREARSGSVSHGIYDIVVADTKNPMGQERKKFEVVAVRFGVNRDTTAVKQLLGLKNKALASRTSMAQIPLPFF
ncbi:NAD(P)-binding protein [Rugamonas sp. CCM 8940]|uniref:NAD(P)-binding protein n=1 Tax=Rugamonas sp. CCM 8940 TaxID=2765359 RepID=UPI0018F61BA1|nr:NAD(P)-binding protein [Rugamonas sp. CCM 8940]MBJ7312223.1 FAD-dependent oxidoreductase [Rugamonas sp. CCM 8940]